MNLAADLAAAGLEPAGPLAPGADGTRWAVRDASGRRWALAIARPTPEGVAALRRRAAALMDVRHDHLAAVGPVVDLADGGLALLEEDVPGTDLATVCTARARWAPGEVVTVVVPLADALAALHDAGVAHGEVSPGTVVLRPDGRPVLVGAVGGSDPERGEPARLSERPHAASDVQALGRLGLLLLDTAGPDAPGVDPSGVGSSGVGSSGVGGPGRAAVLECLAAAASSDPGRRPTARDLSEMLYDACLPAPVAMPDPAVLARVALRRLADPGGDRTGRRGRHRRAGRRRAPVLVALVALVLGAGVVVSTIVGNRTVGVRSPVAGSIRLVAVDPVAESPVTEGLVTEGLVTEGLVTVHPVTAAVRLTAGRARALAAGDLEALRAISVPGSAAARADLRAALRLTARTSGATMPGEARTAVLSAAPLIPGRTGSAQVRVVAQVTLTVPDGAAVGEPPSVPAVGDVPGDDSAAPVVLVLRHLPAGWRVSEVRAP